MAMQRPTAFNSMSGSKLVFWLVNNGTDFAWWAAEKIAPWILIRFVGVRPELLAISPKTGRNRVMNIIRGVEPLSLRFPGINVDSAADFT